MQRWGALIWAFVMALAGSHGKGEPPTKMATVLQQALTALVQQEDQATMKGVGTVLASVFVPDSASAKMVYETALQRMAYMKDWAAARQIRFDHVSVHIRIQS